MTTGDFDPAKAGMVWSDATGWQWPTTLGPNVPLYFPSEEMQTQLTAALARIARLEEGLRPFAEWGEIFSPHDSVGDSPFVRCADDCALQLGATKQPGWVIIVGDLRRARDVLNEGKTGC